MANPIEAGSPARNERGAIGVALILMLLLMVTALCVTCTRLRLTGGLLGRYGGVTPSPAIPPEAVLLTELPLPSGWHTGSIDTSHHAMAIFRGASLAASRSYWPTGAFEQGRIDLLLAWYRTEELAHRNNADLEHPPFNGEEPWREMSQWNYRSPYADEQCRVCVRGEPAGIPVFRCYVIARYGQYLSLLNIGTRPQDLTVDDVKAVIVDADRILAAAE